MNNVALDRPALAAADAVNVTFATFVTPWSAGDSRLTVGTCACASAPRSSRLKLTSVLVGDCWCTSTAMTFVPVTSREGSTGTSCHALSSAPPIAVTARVV